jgi:two-component system, sensor histidine kinase YesM
VKKNSLQFELSLKISVFFIVVIFAVSSAIIIYMSNQYNKIIIQNMNNNIENVVESIDYYFDDVKTPMVMIARNSSILKAVKDYQNMDNREKLDTENSLEDFVQNITAFKSFINDIIIIGNNGYVYNINNNSPDKYLYNFKFLDSSYLKDAEEGTIKLYYLGQHPTEYYISDVRDSKVYSVVLPIRTGKNKLSYIMCDIKAETINEILQNTLKDKRAKMFIQDEQGNILYEEGNIGVSAEEVMEYRTGTGNEAYSKKNIFEILFSKGSYITEVKSDITGWTYIYVEPFKNFNGFIKKVFFFNLIIIIFASTVIIFFTKQLSSQILKPLKNIAFMIQKMKINQGEKNENSLYMKGQNVNKLSIEIEQMIHRIDKLISDNYLSDLKTKDAQIQVLVNQLSPHFLYNTLQLIEYQSHHNQKENITKIINGLSYILRYSISNVKTVCLKEEFSYICSYLDIYCLRYQNKLEYIIIGKEDLESAVIPKMILEPVVENCIKHGFAGNFKDAKIRVTVFQENQKLYIAVRDNGKGIDENELLKLQENLEKMSFLEEHIGLNNIHSIIRLRYGEPFGISIKSQLGEFTEVTLQMPLNLE